MQRRRQAARETPKMRGDAALQGDGHGQGHRQADRRGHGGRPPLDPQRSDENRVLQETRHTTGADGTYAFTIPPDQFAEPYLYIELDVEHPDYATRAGFGYALSMTRKNEKLNERPFFETVELRPAKPITGRVETPEGAPAAGVAILAYSRTDKSRGALRVRLLRQGRRRTPRAGSGCRSPRPARRSFWVLPKDYAPELHVRPRREARRHGDDHPEEGRLRDRPGPRCPGQADRGRVRRGRARARDRAGISRRWLVQSPTRSAGRRRPTPTGDSRSAPLPAGGYSVMPSEPTTTAIGRPSWARRPLPGSSPREAEIKEGETPDPLEIRASPQVVIEGHWVDSKGQPKAGWGSLSSARSTARSGSPGPARPPGQGSR